MFEVQFLVPESDNQGEPFTASDLDAWRRKLLDSFGGFTEYPGTATGGWMDEGGIIYEDENQVFGVTISGLGDGEAVIEAAEFAKELFRQEAIFVRYLGQTEIIG